MYVHFYFDLEPTDVREPLAQFQATRAQKDDLRKLVFTINSTLGDSKLGESELSEGFEVWWPKLEQRFGKIDKLASSTRPVRDDRELLDEILGLVRSLTYSGINLPGPITRFLTTLDWTPEDARMLYHHYEFIKAEIEAAGLAPEDDLYVHLERLKNDSEYALQELKQLKRIHGVTGSLDTNIFAKR
jgi:hypothetical protein